jgi:hypothetical protein
MSPRALIWSLAAIAVLILLSVPELPGALIGIFFGIALAFFVAGPAWVLSAAMGKIGVVASFETVMVGFAVLYAILVVALALAATIAFRNAQPNAARLFVAKTALFAALPVMAFFSSHALQAAWM